MTNLFERVNVAFNTRLVPDFAIKCDTLSDEERSITTPINAMLGILCHLALFVGALAVGSITIAVLSVFVMILIAMSI